MLLLMVTHNKKIGESRVNTKQNSVLLKRLLFQKSSGGVHDDLAGRNRNGRPEKQCLISSACVRDGLCGLLRGLAKPPVIESGPGKYTVCCCSALMLCCTLRMASRSLLQATACTGWRLMPYAKSGRVASAVK